jgi:hypothetical protein
MPARMRPLAAPLLAEDAQKAIKNTPSVEQVLASGIEQYDALFIPGGWVSGEMCVLCLQCHHIRRRWYHFAPVSCCTRTAACRRPRLQARHCV